MLVISNDDVARVLDAPGTVAALEAAYSELATGDGVCRPRIDLRLPTGEAGRVFQWGTMEGGSVGSGYFAIRAKSDVLTEVVSDGNRTQEKYCIEPGTYCGFILLFSVRDAAPLALMNDGVLQHLRVGADSAIGARTIAKRDARVLGMIGSGGMARSHLACLMVTMHLDAVRIYSPTPAHRKAFADEVESQYGIEAVVCESPELACRGADIVSGCTDSVGEVIFGEWLDPGTHVTCVGGRLSPSAISRFDRWLRLGNAPAPLSPPGLGTAAEAVVYQARPGDPVWGEHRVTEGAGRGLSGIEPDRVVFLADLLAGRAPGRTSDEQITFSERGNIQGAQFYAVAGQVYERCVEQGLGHEIPTGWFLQDIRD